MVAYYDACCPLLETQIRGSVDNPLGVWLGPGKWELRGHQRCSAGKDCQEWVANFLHALHGQCPGNPSW